MPGQTPIPKIPPPRDWTVEVQSELLVKLLRDAGLVTSSVAQEDGTFRFEMSLRTSLTPNEMALVRLIRG